MFKLYNSLTRKKQDFKPLNKNAVTMYSCGPTVYGKPHIGNLSSFLTSDLLKRYLKWKGLEVKQVMNLTDVDDKTINGSIKCGVNLETYTKPFIEDFFKDLKALNIEPANHYPKATEYIPKIVEMIQIMLEKGYAYEGDDKSIYFNIKKFKKYGQLVQLNRQRLKKGARVSSDNYDKKRACDFALWKAWSPEDGDVFWETDLGKGRPGWHIECSAMSTSLLGPTIDIHTGAIDLKFPHHSNEIAQSESATGKPFVRFWVHRSYLRMDKDKMSKSLGNVLTLEELINQGFTPRDFRFLVLTNHYRTPLVYSKKSMTAAKNSLKTIDEFVKRLNKIDSKAARFDVKKEIEKTKSKFIQYLDDDLNTPRAMAVLFNFIRRINKEADQENISELNGIKIIEFLTKIDLIWGFIFFGLARKDRKLKPEEKEILAKRKEARKNQDYQTADVLRTKLGEKGIEIRDTKEGDQIWHFK